VTIIIPSWRYWTAGRVERGKIIEPLPIKSSVREIRLLITESRNKPTHPVPCPNLLPGQAWLFQIGLDKRKATQ
jgi:hypothetical protein